MSDFSDFLLDPKAPSVNFRLAMAACSAGMIKPHRSDRAAVRRWAVKHPRLYAERLARNKVENPNGVRAVP